jgi:hypothetical protein
MDKKDIINNLTAVCRALNQIDVRGKQNLMNLSGSIDILEMIAARLQHEIQEHSAKEME